MMKSVRGPEIKIFENHCCKKSGSVGQKPGVHGQKTSHVHIWENMLLL